MPAKRDSKRRRQSCASFNETPAGLRDAWATGKMPDQKPTRPVPFRKREALPVSKDHLCNLYRRFLESISAEQRLRLVQYIDTELQSRWRVATACSGTDGPILSWKALSQVLLADASCQLNIVHQFSCEQNKSKQTFIRAAFPQLSHLFEDCTSLTDVKALDVVTGSMQSVPMELDCLQAGFPCTDVSRMHKDSGSLEHQTCLMDGSLRSGSVFHTLRKFANKCRQLSPGTMQMVMYENVLGLASPPIDKKTKEQVGPTNLQVVCFLLDIDGYFVMVWTLSPCDFSVPQNRVRLYILAVPKSRLDMIAQEATVFCDRTMNALVGADLQDMCDYVLPDDDDHVSRYYRSLYGKQVTSDYDCLESCLQSTWGIAPPLDKGVAQPCKNITWPQKHAEIFAKRGMSWANCQPEPDDSVKHRFPGLFAVKAREFDKLHLAGVTFPESKMRVVELSQSAGRSSDCPAEKGPDDDMYMGTIVPGGRFYATHRCRLLLGVEEMHLQSLWFPPDVEIGVSDCTLRSLAGNAFETSCASATVLCGLLLLSGQRRHSAIGPPPEPCASLQKDIDSDSSDDDVAHVMGKRAKQV